MSHYALQRVVVRMLFDEDFTRRVYDDVRTATRGCGLTEREQSWLVAPDARAYGVDCMRRSRALTGLLEEYPVSCALVAREQRREAAVAWLDAYFASRVFHDALQHGASLAESFGAWLASRASEIALSGWSACVLLEATIVRARRQRERAPDQQRAAHAALETSWLVLAPGVAVCEVPERSAFAYGEILASLRAHRTQLVEAVLDPPHTLPDLRLGERAEGVLVHGQTAHIRLETVGLALARVLAACARAISFDDFVERAGAEGATADDCKAIAESCADDGIVLLIARP